MAENESLKKCLQQECCRVLDQSGSSPSKIKVRTSVCIEEDDGKNEDRTECDHGLRTHDKHGNWGWCKDHGDGQHDQLDRTVYVNAEFVVRFDGLLQ